MFLSAFEKNSEALLGQNPERHFVGFFEFGGAGLAVVAGYNAADVESALAMTSLVSPFNLSGHPAISSPLPTDGFRPISIQLVGRRSDDAALCSVASFVERHFRQISRNLS